MVFEKILIEKNDGAINGELQQLEVTKNYFQNYLNKVIQLGITTDKNDLNLLFENPKAYITDKLTHGENMQVGNLKLNKEKLFDLIEKPVGTTELIESIEKDLADKNTREYHIWKVKNFSINENLVIVETSFLEHLNKRFSLYIENENQKLGFEKLQQIANLLNEINQLDGKKINLDTELNELLKSTDKIFEVKQTAVKLFN